jgi:hypothetical protein
LDLWLREELPARFEGRIVPVDEQVANACSRLLARARHAGRGLGPMDALIAATSGPSSRVMEQGGALDGRSAKMAWRPSTQPLELVWRSIG